MNKKSLKDVKVNNTTQVLEYILRQEPVSRIEIAERSGLSPSTVSQAVSFLLGEGVVEEVREGESTGGRKPILLQMKADYGCVITVEIRRDGVKAVIFDLGGKPACRKSSVRKIYGGQQTFEYYWKFGSEYSRRKYRYAGQNYRTRSFVPG